MELLNNWKILSDSAHYITHFYRVAWVAGCWSTHVPNLPGLPTAGTREEDPTVSEGDDSVVISDDDLEDENADEDAGHLPMEDDGAEFAPKEDDSDTSLVSSFDDGLAHQCTAKHPLCLDQLFTEEAQVHTLVWRHQYDGQHLRVMFWVTYWG
ncbi:Ff.00g133320.m01.CDS01 [Fusarium sp. VM40]|nr:Ff.00g133320.m01.CDS01 [Fusarium sp. VM40]